MTFQVEQNVVKPNLGICKIIAVRRMQVEGKEQQFYVLQSGDVKVMVPFAHAHTGGLRLPLDEQGIEKLFDYLQEPIPAPDPQTDIDDMYPVDVDQAKDEIKQRDPDVISKWIKTLFYKEKTVELSKGEADIYKNALALLAEEIAHVNHISRLKASNRIKSILKTGRSAEQDAS